MTEPPQPPGGTGGPDWGDMKDKMMAARGPDRMILAAGVLFLVDSFLPWYGVSFGPISANIKGWSSGGIAVLSIICAILALALAVVRVAGINVTLPAKDGVIYAVLGLGAFIFALLRLVTETNFTKYGLYVAIVLGAVLAYSGIQKNKAQSS